MQVSAQTFNLVPGSLIQDTIALASAGDVIQLAAGEYVGDIDFLGKAITIRGVGDTTVLKGTGIEAVVSFKQAETNTSILEMLTVTGAQNKAAIVIEGSSPRISNCEILQNQSSTNASGISINGEVSGVAAVIRNNILALNRSATKGSDPHQINISGASPLIANNTIVRGDSNAIFVQGQSSPVIVNNILAFNGSGNKGRGICLVNLPEGSSANINHNLFYQNNVADVFVNGTDYKNVEKAQDLESFVGLSFTLVDNLHDNPRFIKLRKIKSLDLRTNSPAIDSGNPDAQYNDKDASRNDIGFTGGQGSAFSSVVLF
jgi:hypothetical protein